MAVEARHLNLFSPQIICNRDMSIMNVMEGTGNLYTGNEYSGGIGYGLAETVMPAHGSTMIESFPAKAAATIKAADSGLTYALPASVTAAAVSRKRSRDDNMNALPLLSYGASRDHNHRSYPSSVSPVSFIGDDIPLQIHQQQLEIDRVIAQHNEKVRIELEERRKRNSRRMIAAIEERVMKKLREKDEEIEKINKLNWALEERVRILCVENEMWRDFAQMNEATGNALRTNLEQVLAQRQRHGGDAASLELADDAQSCCGSNFDHHDESERRTLANGAAGSRGDCRTLPVMKNMNGTGNDGSLNGAGEANSKLCRSCGREESCVLLLPCRHLCLCTVCGSSLHVCPICKSPKNASLHVNF